MLENWEKTSFSEERRYYAKNESGSFFCDEQGTLTYFEAAEKNQLHQAPFGYSGSGMKSSILMMTVNDTLIVDHNDTEKVYH